MTNQAKSDDITNEIQRLTESSTQEIFEELKSVGIDIDESLFRKVASKYHSISLVSKRWNADAKANHALVYAATVVLWDRLCVDLFLWERCAGQMKKGIGQIRLNQRTSAIDIWLQVWAQLQAFAEANGVRDVSRLDMMAPDNLLPEDLFSFVQDVEAELTNQLNDDIGVAPTLIGYVQSFQKTLPKSATAILLNMQAAEAQAYFALGQVKEADTICQQLCDAYPDDAWTFIDWGDAYHPQYHRNPELVDAQKSRQIYSRGLLTAERDKFVLEDRLASLS